MKKFALLSLRNGGNRVIADCNAKDLKGAIEWFNQNVKIHFLAGLTYKLDDNGYIKFDDCTICIAEYFPS